MHLQVSAAHYFRGFCRHFVLLARPDDARLQQAAECTRTVHCVNVPNAAAFVRSLRA